MTLVDKKDGVSKTTKPLIPDGCEISESSGSGDGKNKMQFSGSCSFVISLLGYSMGTSDFWRFPYLVFRNGGGAFLIPFALTMMVCGIPMFFLEVSMSQFSGKGPMNLWDMSPFFKGIGFVLLSINIVNNIYYNILRAWILEYVVGSFNSELPWEKCDHDWNKAGCISMGKDGGNQTIVGQNITAPGNMTSAEQFWQYRVLQLSSGLDDPGGIMWHFVLYIFVWRLLVGLCMIKSIKSIEKVMYVTVFIPIVLMLVLWARALTLEGSVKGMLYFITPTFSRISDPKVWLEAALMAFYTLGPGWGSLPMIGSHNKFSSNCLRHSVITTVCDCISAVMNGLICFAILGVMAHDSGLDLEKTVTSGQSLGFTVYPTAFTYFPLQQIWSAIFFINLMLVGLDSQVLSTETVMSCFQDICPGWFRGKRRLFMITIVNIMAFLLTLPFCTHGGCYIFQLIDWYAMAWSVLFISLVENITFMWIYGGDRISRDLTLMLGRPLPVFFRIGAAVFTPLLITVLLLMSFIQYRPPSYGKYIYPAYAEGIGWGLAIAMILPLFIVFVWKWVKTDGSWIEKFHSIPRPSSKWVPNDVLSKETYHNTIISERSFMSTLVYNITGRNRAALKHTQAKTDYHEVSPVLKENEIRLKNI